MLATLLPENFVSQRRPLPGHQSGHHPKRPIRWRPKSRTSASEVPAGSTNTAALGAIRP